MAKRRKIIKKPWIMFQPVGAPVTYLWNGRWPIIVDSLNKEENDKWRWMGSPAGELPPVEVRALNGIARDPFKNKFRLSTRKGVEYEVIDRGNFPKYPDLEQEVVLEHIDA